MKEDLSLMDFYLMFSDEEKCIKYIENLRWPFGIKCPRCNESKLYNLNNKKQPYRCSGCGYKFCYKSGTIFEASKLPITKWLFLIYMEAINKKNISSIQMAKNLKVTQLTMWGMQHKIRMSLKQNENIKLSGIVEVDEVFVSKGNKWTRWGGITTRKEPILGLIERGGNVVIKCINDRKRETIVEIIKHHVVEGSSVYTDGAIVYQKLPAYYKHEYVEHSTREYVRGDVHTNNIENVWSIFKKSIRNAHHSISAKHIQIYCDQMAFKFNNRNLSSFERFNKMMELCLQGSVIFRGKEKADKYYLQY